MKVNSKVHSLKVAKQPKNDPYRKVAKKMEENFLNFLIQKMRQSSPASEDKSTSMNYYKGLLDQERAKIMAEANGGVGIQDVILRQIAPGRYKANSIQQPSLRNIQAMNIQKGKNHE